MRPKMPSDIGNMLILGAISTIIAGMFMTLFRFVRDHPIWSVVIVIAILIFQWFYGFFGFDVVDVRKYKNMTEVEIGREIEATECRPEGATTFCEYDFGRTKIWYNANSKPVRMEMEAKMSGGSFAMDEEFYAYALHRIGIEEYHEPSTANIDRIVWTNANGINAQLESNQYLTPSKWTIEFNSNAGI